MAVAGSRPHEKATVPSPIGRRRPPRRRRLTCLPGWGARPTVLRRRGGCEVVGPNAVRSHRVRALQVLASQLRSPLLILSGGQVGRAPPGQVGDLPVGGQRPQHLGVHISAEGQPVGGSIRRRARPVPAAEGSWVSPVVQDMHQQVLNPGQPHHVGQSDTGNGGGCHHGYLPASSTAPATVNHAPPSQRPGPSRAGGFAGTARSLAWEAARSRPGPAPVQAGKRRRGRVTPR